MKTKVPKSVNICGHVYKVFILEESKFRPSLAGLTEFPKRHITINKSLSHELRWLTFLHEIKHAFDYENGDTQIFTAQTAEKSCEQFSSFISSLQKQGVL